MATIRFRDKSLVRKRELKQERIGIMRKKLTIARVCLAISVISNIALAHFTYQAHKTVINSAVMDFIHKYFNN